MYTLYMYVERKERGITGKVMLSCACIESGGVKFRGRLYLYLHTYVGLATTTRLLFLAMFIALLVGMQLSGISTHSLNCLSKYFSPVNLGFTLKELAAKLL